MTTRQRPSDFSVFHRSIPPERDGRRKEVADLGAVVEQQPWSQCYYDGK